MWIIAKISHINLVNMQRRNYLITLITGISGNVSCEEVLIVD